MTAIYDLLEAARREQFGGSVTRLSVACRVSVALGSRWVHPDEHKRMIPSPPSCQKISTALGLDPDYVLELAGHRKPRKVAREPDLIEQYIRQGTAQMPAVLVGIPRKMWGPIIKLTFDRAIDGARDMAALLLEQQSQPRTAKNRNEARATTHQPVRSTGANRGGGKLRLPERVAAFALAGT